MFSRVGVGLAVALATGSAAPAAHAAALACQMVEVGALAVTMRGDRPQVLGELDGKPVWMVIGTGSAATTIWSSAVRDLGLQEKRVGGVIIYGAGGTGFTATVHELKLDKLVIRHVDLLVGEPKTSDGDAGVIGEDVLSRADLEIDLAGGAIRFFAPKNCSGDQVVYWGKAYSVAPIVASNDSRDLAVEVLLNGKAIRADLDSGSSASVVSPYVAQSVGATLQDDSATHAGGGAGSGRQIEQPYAGVFTTVSFGDETIRNARLSIADLSRPEKAVEIGDWVPTSTYAAPQMLLGADFLRAHRVYIARSQNKVYVSYQGGPVFEAPQRPAPPTAASAPPPGR